MSKTEKLKRRIAKILCIARQDEDNTIQILKAIKDMDMAFVDRKKELPEMTKLNMEEFASCPYNTIGNLGREYGGATNNKLKKQPGTKQRK